MKQTSQLTIYSSLATLLLGMSTHAHAEISGVKFNSYDEGATKETISATQPAVKTSQPARARRVYSTQPVAAAAPRKLSGVKGVKLGSYAPVAKPVTKRVQNAPRRVAADNTLLLDNLKGIVVIGNYRQLRSTGIDYSGLFLKDKKVPVPPTVWNAMKAALNKPMSMSSLQKLKANMTAAYHKAGFQTVSIVTPPQDVRKGALQVHIVAGRLGKLHVKGNQRTGKNYFYKNFNTKPGELLKSDNVVADLRHLNRNALRKVDLVYEPGHFAGQTDVTMLVKEKRPYGAYIGADNNGSKTFDRLREHVGGYVGNFAGLDNYLHYRFSKNDGKGDLESHYLQYRQMLKNRTELRADLSQSEYTLNANQLNYGGKNTALKITGVTPKKGKLLGYSGELIRGLILRHDKGISDKDIVSQFTNNVLAKDSNKKTKTVAAVLGWAGERSIGNTTHRAHVNLEGSLKGETDDPNNYIVTRDELTETLDKNIKDFSYQVVRAGIDTRKEMQNGMTLLSTVRGHAGFNSGDKNSSSSLYLGGKGSVRGWHQSSTRVDSGAVSNTTLYTNNVLKKDGHSLRPYVFGDIGLGRVDVESGSSEEKSRTMIGAGVGLSYQFKRNVTADLSYGHQLQEDGFDDGDDGMAYTSINVTY